uniref:hypothetical protein n=1 Tax=Drechslerella dactyloides TaxID=74499 RepID=UPI0022FD99BA|nr:hypothetical protein PNX16_mgp024 [Drechslerella dactyloides]WAN89827.1 hypothetical protein [Drechslerella dactyloides]
MPCITELYNIFYSNGQKVIPQDIYDLLSPVALAHLIKVDGSVERHGLIICTDFYSVQDVVRIINVMIIRYRLEYTLRFHTPTQPRIYIRECTMLMLRQIVNLTCDSMLYKIKF